MNKFKNIKLFKNNQKEIPIFFATDDNYVPFLEITLRSIIANASKKYKYVINVLNTGLNPDRVEKVMRLENENFKINFCDLTEYVEPIKNKLKNVYHFSLVTWYRLFIESLFPQYDKALYLDCDIIVLGDISKLYNTQLGNNLLGAVKCHIVSEHPIFSQYARVFCGVDPEKYFNAGILVMNLKEFRKSKIEDKFVYLINKYNFDVIDPDQGYLNALCRNRVKLLPNGWNKESIDTPLQGELNIVHYALYKKPWQYDDVINQEYFWQFAKESPFYDEILTNKANFDDVKKVQKEKANIEIVEHATRVINAEKSFNNILFKHSNPLEMLNLEIGECLSNYDKKVEA